MRKNLARVVCVFTCALSMLSVQTMARADVIGAEQFLSAVDRKQTLDRVHQILARAEVQRALEQHGVDAAAASERVAALNDQELVLLAENLEELPAGGSLLGTIGIVFVVLLILELVGVIDIFKKV